MERFKREIREQFSELREIESVEEMEKFLKNTYRKAKNEGDNDLYTAALNAYNRLLCLNKEI